MKEKITSKQGFYIGDVCYVLSDEDYSKEWGKKNGYKNGIIKIRDYCFAVYGTAEGDGCYYDNDGHSYDVDAGVIGVVPRELCLKEEPFDEDDLDAMGRYVEGTEATLNCHGYGVFDITVGKKNITIDTGHEDEEDYDDDEDEEEDDED